MDIKDIIIFQKVAKVGNITKAAKQLNFVQSNVTARIHKLESELNTTLFYRHSKGIKLTSTGRVFLGYSEKILKLLEDSKKAVNNQEKPEGSLLIGSMESTAAIRLPQILASYQKKYPEVNLSLQTMPTDDLINLILNYELDGAFVAMPVTHPDLICKTVFEEELILISNSPKHPLKEIENIKKRTLLVFRPSCSYRKILEHWLNHEGVTPAKTIELGSHDAIIGCVSAGLGISLIPKSVIKNHHDLYCFDIPEVFSKVKTGFVQRKDVIQSAALKAFMNCLPTK